jgi:tetratricopeptide (TPR) repeat protein
VAQSLNNLGNALRKLGDLVTAQARIVQAIAILERQLGPDNRFVGIGLFNLALVLHEDGDSERARDLLERAIGIQESRLGSR